MTEPAIKPIDAYWQRYHDGVLLPADVGITQIIETRRAFYAGCQALFSLVTEKAASMSDQEAAAHFASIETELNWFKDLMKARQA